MPDRIADPATSEGISEGDNASAEENVICTACPLCDSVVALVDVYEPTKVNCQSCGLAFVVDGCSPPEQISADGPDSDARRQPDALDRWLAGEPIRPRVLSDRERLWRWCKKRPYLAGASATLLVAVTLGAVVSAGAYVLASSRLGEIAQMRKAAAQDRQQALALAARKARLAAEERRWAESETAARRMVEHRCEEIERRRREAERLYQLADRRRLDLEREAQLALVRQMACESRSVMATNPLRSLRLAAEAIRAMLREGEPPDLDAQQTFRDALSLVGGRGLSGHRGTIEALAVSPDSRWLASGGSDGTVRLWNLAGSDPAADPLILKGHRGRIGALAISRCGRWLATGSFDKTVRLWNLRAANPAASCILLSGHDGEIYDAAFDANSRWLVTGSFDRTVRLWDLAAEHVDAASIVLLGHTGPISALAITPDCRLLATVSSGTLANTDSVVRLWDLPLKMALETASHTVARQSEADDPDKLAARPAPVLR